MTIYSLIKAVKQKFKKLWAFVPTLLPIGVEAFHTWAADVLGTYGFPDNDSTRWALTTMIIHLGPTAAYKPKRYFGLALHAAAAKQVAGGIFHEIKTRQMEAQKAEKAAEAAAAAALVAAKKQAEATATASGSVNVLGV